MRVLIEARNLIISGNVQETSLVALTSRLDVQFF
jgi:hypothetical protein